MTETFRPGTTPLDDVRTGRPELVAVCRAAGVDLDDASGPSALADYIETAHHAALWSELPRLSDLAAQVEKADGTRHPELIAVRTLFDELRYDLESHLMREEQIVFPLIREIVAASASLKRPNGTLHNPIDVLDDDHERVGEVLDELVALTDAFTVPEGASPEMRSLYNGLAAFASDTRLHIQLEDHLLLPAVAAVERDLLALLDR